MPGHRNTGHGSQQVDTPADLRPVSDSFRRAKSTFLNWLYGVLALLVVSIVTGGYWCVSDTRERMVRVETKLEAVEKTLDHIENNIAPHDGRMATGDK